MVADDTVPQPKPEPLFSLDLGANGGRLAPITPSEISEWIKPEYKFWVSILQRSYGNHEQGMRDAADLLRQAMEASDHAAQFIANDLETARARIETARAHIEEVYLRRLLPHSSSTLGHRVWAFRENAGEQATTFFVSPFVRTANKMLPKIFDQDVAAWHGALAGLLENFRLAEAAPKARKVAAEQSFERLRERAEQLVADKVEAYEAILRDYTKLSDSVRTMSESQSTGFEQTQIDRQAEFEELKATHRGEMEGLRRLFREEIALRAPADYWQSKKLEHAKSAHRAGILSFGGIALAVVVLGWQIHDILGGATRGSAPDTWRLGLLALLALFILWALRLVVRIFLSHLHLVTDAEERVVMVHTYLSMVEGGHMTAKEDRQLILQALFRPASDGIVKDEGVPFSLAEALTRK